MQRCIVEWPVNEPWNIVTLFAAALLGKIDTTRVLVYLHTHIAAPLKNSIFIPLLIRLCWFFQLTLLYYEALWTLQPLEAVEGSKRSYNRAPCTETFFSLCPSLCRGVCVLRHGVLCDLHLPGALLSDAEQKLAGFQCFHRKQQQGQRGRGFQLRHLPEARHAAHCQHLQPAVHRCHPGQERYI